MDMTKIYEGINSTFLNYKDATELILKCKCPIHKCDLIYNDKDNMWGCDTDDCSVKVQLGGGGHYELSEGPDKLINCLMFRKNEIKDLFSSCNSLTTTPSTPSTFPSLGMSPEMSIMKKYDSIDRKSSYMAEYNNIHLKDFILTCPTA